MPNIINSSRPSFAKECFVLQLAITPFLSWGWITITPIPKTKQFLSRSTSISSPVQILPALSDRYLENDLVAIRRQPVNDSDEPPPPPLFCVVRRDNGVHPLCTHEDDVETDLYVDPRQEGQPWTYDTLLDDDVISTYGEGWYGQRPVPSLGGGPGYGAEADDVWSVDEELLERLVEDGVDLPVLDVGIAHGEKARGGALF
mmetsp:Transcript_46331/g.68369  ORF Transcript_46331/g.68369 Transcript_46331/m.68369 type:complete len:201 (-) Transcript_46331:515-1117(-)